VTHFKIFFAPVVPLSLSRHFKPTLLLWHRTTISYLWHGWN